MAVMDNAGSPNVEMDVTMRIWNLINEVSDQLSQNRAISNTLHSIAGGVKVPSLLVHICAQAPLNLTHD